MTTFIYKFKYPPNVWLTGQDDSTAGSNISSPSVSGLGFRAVFMASEWPSGQFAAIGDSPDARKCLAASKSPANPSSLES
jgi:hypothetical protein